MFRKVPEIMLRIIGNRVKIPDELVTVIMTGRSFDCPLERSGKGSGSG